MAIKKKMQMGGSLDKPKKSPTSAPKTDKFTVDQVYKTDSTGNVIKSKPKMKMGGAMKKAQDGSSLGMKSVKAGYDNNKGVTRADFVSIGKGEAKSGASLKKQAATAIAMKKAGVKPKGMKSGGSMKKCKYGCK